MTHSEQQGTLQYLVRVPDAPLPRPAPVLCFLHGYDEGAPTDLRAGVARHGPLRPDAPTAAIDQFIVIAPRLPVRGDVWRQYAGAVSEIMEESIGRHGGDMSRCYLSGFSFGGNGVFDLGSRQPSSWAALWAVDPTRVPLANLPGPIWLSIGAVARHATHRFVNALRLAPYDGVVEAHRVYLDEGADHVGSATLAYRDERIYSWLLSKRRAA